MRGGGGPPGKLHRLGDTHIGPAVEVVRVLVLVEVVV